MKPLIRYAVTVGLLAVPLILGSSDVYSAKKTSGLSDLSSTNSRLADSTKATRRPAENADRQDLRLHIDPSVSSTPGPAAPKRLTTGDVAPAGSASPSAIENNWISINHGGATEVASGNLRLGITIGQPVAGFVAQGDYQLGLGYWYGAGGGGGACDCPNQADYDHNGLIDNLDLNFMIDVLFFNYPNIQDPNCPAVLVDFNCDGLPDNLDLNFLIDYMFFNGADPCQPCDCVSYPVDCPNFP